MQFNSYIFVFMFLPITVCFYFMMSHIKSWIGKVVLISASIFFYSFGHKNMLLYLGISIVINYAASLLIKKSQKRLLVALPIIVNVGLLLYFKYLNFSIININQLLDKSIPLKEIILPLGISFYTFQQIAYVVSRERGELNDSDLVDYLVYVLYFPKLIMGPLIEPVDFISQINDESKKKIDINNIAMGLKIFSFGLFKKLLFADTFAKAVAWIYENLDAATSMDCLLLVLFYTFEIYFDFSGYSDMSVGVSLLFNIDLPINFDSPYKAISIRDFWKRWHISLTRFLTKYVYIPLGGAQKGRILTYVNVMVVFFISGLWHGANWTFILWGILHGMLSCIDRLFDTFERKIFLPIRWKCTFVLVSVLWLLFSAESVRQWCAILMKILLMQNTLVSEGVINIFKLAESQFIYNMLHLEFISNNIRGFSMIIFIISAAIICFVPENNYRNKTKLDVKSMILASGAFMWSLLCLGSESAFIYVGF